MATSVTFQSTSGRTYTIVSREPKGTCYYCGKEVTGENILCGLACRLLEIKAENEAK